MNKTLTHAEKLLAFIQKSPTAFHAVEALARELDAKGFKRLNEYSCEPIVNGGKYYITRNDSSLLAFQIPENEPRGFMICASHSDSPTFKLKPNANLEAFGQYLRLNTERYGGMILSSWFDRPLSVAGRVVLETEQGLETRLVNIDRSLLVIPNVAIHMNRTLNDGFKYNPQCDTLPLFAEKASEIRVNDLLAEECNVHKDSLIGHDLFLYSRDKGELFGAAEEFFLAPRIDNLECAWTSLQGFLEAVPTRSIPLYAVFDNEETGSESKQGAASDFLLNTITRITASLGCQNKTTALLASSFMLSADNAHGRHPNHPELADGENTPVMNGGIVIKYNASQRYTTDGVSAALFKTLCKRIGVPTQVFANRSDMAGGSTLGSISNTKVSVKTVDIGLAQLAMHSACETAGVRDIGYMIAACREFFSSALLVDQNHFNLIR